VQRKRIDGEGQVKAGKATISESGRSQAVENRGPLADGAEGIPLEGAWTNHYRGLWSKKTVNLRAAKKDSNDLQPVKSLGGTNRTGP